MFDFAEVQPATDALWQAWANCLRREGLDAPDQLMRPEGSLFEHWLEPNLLLSQVCGYPYRAHLAQHVGLVGTLVYDGSDRLDPRRYRTVLVARANDKRVGAGVAAFAGARLAANGSDSLSGWISLAAGFLSAGTRPHRPVTITGAHAASLAALQHCDADLASIDVVTWQLLSSVRPEAVHGLSVVGRGPLVGCLPLITAEPDSVPAIRRAIVSALASVDADVTRSLLIQRFIPLSVSDYDHLLPIAEQAYALLPPPDPPQPQRPR
jgi:ABC-type phosphate/phosphonate transport system substrate-binding protein